MGAIGVFDSGVGGLSVLREIRRELPNEALLYVADSAHAPYGDKPAEFVVERSQAISSFLIQQGATSLVVACNTATAVAIDVLRTTHALPIVGVEPAVKPAVERTRAGVVGVLTTSRTALSSRFRKLLTRFGESTRIVVQPCPGWVDLVERGLLEGPEVERSVKEYVAPLLAEGADVLALGCTHYSFLATTIRRVAGGEAELVDPAPAVARHLRHRLEHAQLLEMRSASERHWTSAVTHSASALTTRLLGRPTEVLALPAPYRGKVLPA